MKGLQSRGIEVVASMPGFTYLAEKHYNDIPEEQRRLLWRWETQDDIFRREKPDAVLFASNWDHFNINVDIDVPLIIDLHGSRLIETTMWGNPIDTEKKVKTFARADCLLCAGQRQQYYFSGWLLQAGRVPHNEHFIRYIPVSLGPDMPEHVCPTDDSANHPNIVSGGGWFPWQNQSTAIFAACRAVTSMNTGTVNIYGTPHETATISPEEEVIRRIYGDVKQLSETSPRVNVNGYIGRDDLIEVYRHAGVALEVMRYNLEREFAFTTRTIEYLWCGLPVLYNNYGEIAGHIAEYDAGWTVDPSNVQEIETALHEILTSPETLRRKSENAQRLVRDRFTWDKTIEPLVRFLNNPVKAGRTEVAMGSVFARPAFMSPRAGTYEVSIPADGKVVRQDFVVPAENIGAIEVPLALAQEDEAAISNITIRVVRKDGRVVAEQQYSGSALPKNGKVEIPFPLLRRPSGGESLGLELSAVSSPAAASSSAGEQRLPSLILQGMTHPRFPFSKARVPLRGTTLLGQPVVAEAVVLHFLAAGGRYYRLKSLASRGVLMIRRGEWKRLARAAASRVPRLFQRVRYAVASRM